MCKSNLGPVLAVSGVWGPGGSTIGQMAGLWVSPRVKETDISLGGGGGENVSLDAGAAKTSPSLWTGEFRPGKKCLTYTQEKKSSANSQVQSCHEGGTHPTWCKNWNGNQGRCVAVSHGCTLKRGEKGGERAQEA